MNDPFEQFGPPKQTDFNEDAEEFEFSWQFNDNYLFTGGHESEYCTLYFGPNYELVKWWDSIPTKKEVDKTMNDHIFIRYKG